MSNSEKKVPMSNAERQRNYRRRQKNAERGEGSTRVTSFISTRSMHSLKLLSETYGATQKQMLEQLIAIAEEATASSVAKEFQSTGAEYFRRKVKKSLDDLRLIFRDSNF